MSDEENFEPGSDLVAPDSQSQQPRFAAKTGMWGAKGGAGDTSGYGGMVRLAEEPGTAQRPYGGWFDEVVDTLEECVPGSVQRVVVHGGELTIEVDPAKMREIAQAMRDDVRLRFEGCMSVSGVHYPADKGHELHAVYHLLSYTHNRRVRLEAGVPDGNAKLPSVVPVYPGADWHERETWDMFGIEFEGHPGLTRILMPDDWPGHPQRKDYPLGGVPIEYKGAEVPSPENRRQY